MSGIIQYKYHSMLASHIEAFVKEKRASGFSYNNEAKFLRNFDNWLMENPAYNIGFLSKEVVLAWLKKRKTESINSRNYRVAPVRLLAKYMLSIGIDSYVAPKCKKEPRDLHYVPSMDEFQQFFLYVDTDFTDFIMQGSCSDNKRSRKASLHQLYLRSALVVELPVIFRLYYCLGLRLNEATSIKTCNIDFKTGKLLLEQTKGDKHRYVFIPKDMLSLVKRMLTKLHELKIFSDWLFPSANTPTRHINGANVSQYFRTAWIKCFKNTSKHTPTIRGLRHAFVVFRITRWLTEGKDLNVMIPYLSRHLGHATVNETYTYFQQVKHLCPAVKQFLEQKQLFTKDSYGYHDPYEEEDYSTN